LATRLFIMNTALYPWNESTQKKVYSVVTTVQGFCNLIIMNTGSVGALFFGPSE